MYTLPARAISFWFLGASFDLLKRDGQVRDECAEANRLTGALDEAQVHAHGDRVHLQK